VSDEPAVCQIVMQRTPQVVVGETHGRDFTHLQVCGRPVVEDGLCSVHLRRQARVNATRKVLRS
jgi:hypothetical protein